MLVRPAMPNDIERCLHLDGTVMSQVVWNMRQTDERGCVSTVFSPVRLPRPLELPYPVPLYTLAEQLQRGDCVLVAQDEDGQIVGCLAMSRSPVSKFGLVDHLVVTADRRRAGIGTALLGEAVRRVWDWELQGLVVPCQARNGVGIAFCQHLGLEFSGYCEHYYAEHDIALLFVYQVKR